MDATLLSILYLVAAYIGNASGGTTSSAPTTTAADAAVATTAEELTTGYVSTTIDYSDNTPWYLQLTFLVPTAGAAFLLGCFFAVMGCRAFCQAKCPKYCPDDIPDPPPPKKKKEGDKDAEKKKKRKKEPKWIRKPPAWLEESDNTKVWIEQPPSWMVGPDPMNPEQPSWLDNPPAWMNEPLPESESEDEIPDSADYIPPDDNAPRKGHSWD